MKREHPLGKPDQTVASRSDPEIAVSIFSHAADDSALGRQFFSDDPVPDFDPGSNLLHQGKAVNHPNPQSALPVLIQMGDSI